MIEGVTFDWWNTIALTTPDQDRRLRELRIDRALEAMAGCSVTRDGLLRAYDRQTEFLQEHWRRNVDVRPMAQIEAFLEFAEVDGADASLVERISESFGEAIVEVAPTLFPHAAEALEALSREGVAIGLISNTGRTWGRYLRKVQDRLGIGRFFDVRVFSDEVGIRKPAPGIFSIALENLGLPPEEVVHVGDDSEADVAGAKAIGMLAVWFSTGRAGHRPGYGQWTAESTGRADAAIHDHAELPVLLREWRR